ncbi:hypothetical protein N7532_006459 [Penicillium argentinense]|uniref:Uncharacterized protein n=1 Tax=Penicillium argentinense TaxID=1131581 RepID=A0A9W9FFV2_9EURO|nr:uncharacterized protein N7532_006459 [Penicillium argentinense]KAJ5099458.1 hypothetical protein N7532_006459 [Penicillium argentinense]
MPSLWWEDYVRSSNGFFGSETTREPGTEGLNTWAFFETKLLDRNMCYYWWKFNIFTRHTQATNQTGILMFDTEEFRPFVMESENGKTHFAHLRDPLWMYTHALERVAQFSEKAVWNIRDQVRMKEKEVKTDYRRLHHDVARHAYHVSESLDVTVNTLDHILRYHESHIGPKRADSDLYGKEVSVEVWEDVHARLAFFQSYFASLRHRSVANEKRVHNEIALSFNMGAQDNAAITVEISRATKEDSGTMKTLSLVTLTFLPPTFICAVFSMSFFNYADSGWRVSEKIWIYWAFAIPTTLVCVLIWYGWTKIFPGDSNEQGIERRPTIRLSDMP